MQCMSHFVKKCYNIRVS